jgi:nicotinamide riboside kinase
VPEVQRYADKVRVAATPEQFVAACEQALHEGGASERAARSAAMQGETWAARVAQVARTVDEIFERKQR